MGDFRDEALRRLCPVVGAPRFDTLERIETGQRIVLARNGVFAQVRTPWMDCLQRIGDLDPRFPLAFGDAEESLRLAFGTIPIRLLEEFISVGRAALPNEIAGGLIYDALARTLRLAIFDSLDSGYAHVRYRLPVLRSEESIAVDLHTHGRLPAHFSDVDDADDMGIKVAGVFGNLDRPHPSAAFRLVLNGWSKPIPNPWHREGDGLDGEPSWEILSLEHLF